MYSHVILVVIFFLFLPEELLALNECGGERLLRERLNDICETNLYGECPFGRLTCTSKNGLQCTPQCNLSLLDIHQSLCIECRNNGTYSLEDRKCLCSSGYGGELCEIEDFCARTNCGLFGVCSSSESRCACNKGFSGDHCEINDDCRGFEFIWDGQTCQCNEDFDGIKCSRCSVDLICIPSNVSYGYVLARIPNRHLVEKLLEFSSSLSPEYSERTAFRPLINPVTRQCTCSIPPKNDLLIAGYFEEEEEEERGLNQITTIIRDDSITIAYIDNVYRRQYEDYVNDSVSIYARLLAFVCVVMFILSMIGFTACVFFISNGKSTNRRK